MVGYFRQGGKRRRIAPAITLDTLIFGLGGQPPLPRIRMLVGDDAKLFGLQTIDPAKGQQVVARQKIAEPLLLAVQTGLDLLQPGLIPFGRHGVGIDPLLHAEGDMGLGHLVGHPGGQLGGTGFETYADQLGIAHRRDGQVLGQVIERMLVTRRFTLDLGLPHQPLQPGPPAIRVRLTIELGLIGQPQTGHHLVRHPTRLEQLELGVVVLAPAGVDPIDGLDGEALSVSAFSSSAALA